MAVALRGYTQGSVAGVGYSVAWPAGTVAGDMALVHCDGNRSASMVGLGPQGTGWTPCGVLVWWKVLTAADLASPLQVNATHVKLQTFAGAGGVGRTSSQTGVTIQQAGSGLWLDGASDAASLAPATYRLGSEWRDEQGLYQGAYFLAVGAGYQSLPGASWADWHAVEVLPAEVPAAPILLSPGDAGHVDRTRSVTYSWQHQSMSPQTAYRLKASADLGTWWLGPAGSWVTSETDVPGGAQSVTAPPPPADLASGAVWSMSTQSALGWGPYSSANVWLDRPAQVASVSVAVSAGDLSPTVSWSETASAEYGGVSFTRDSWRVRVTPASSTSPDVDTLYDSGALVTATTTHDVPASTPWPTNGGSYKAWVTLYGRGMESSLSSSPFVVSWTPPATPTVTAVDGAPPVVTVAGLASGHLVTVEMLAGGVWRPLTLRTAAGATLAVDAPLAAGAVKFRARQGDVVDGAPMQSAWAESAQITVSANGRAYLVDDADRSTYLAIEQHQDTDQRRTIVQGVSTFYGLGATSARVEQTPAAGQAGAFSVLVGTEAGASDVWAWLEARDVFWFRQRPDYWGTKAVEAVRVARTSRLGSERVVGSSGWRRLDVEWVEQPE